MKCRVLYCIVLHCIVLYCIYVFLNINEILNDQLKLLSDEIIIVVEGIVVPDGEDPGDEDDDAQLVHGDDRVPA